MFMILVRWFRGLPEPLEPEQMRPHEMENRNRCDIARRANRMRGVLAATAPAVVAVAGLRAIPLKEEAALW